MKNTTTQASTTQNQASDNPGYLATAPHQFCFKSWFQVLWRVKDQIEYDHVQVVAAGVAFYFFLAMFPLLAAVVSTYGLVMDPAEVVRQIQSMAAILPQDAKQMIADILANLAGQSTQSLSWSFALSVLLSLWSSKKGVTALFEGINIAYNERDNRHFLIKYALTFSFTIGLILLGFFCLTLVVGFPVLIEKFGLPEVIQTTLSWCRWPLLAMILIFGLSFFYKIAPHRSSPQFKWVGVGSVIAALLWTVGSLGFSYYVDNFGSYNKTYGSFAAVIILLLWLFLTAFIVLLGAEINSELEHQTSIDTTVGNTKPLGERNAYYADNVP